MKLAYGNSILNVISAYAPQVGCQHEEKSQFYEHLEQIMRNIKQEEKILIGADLNGHVRRHRSGFEQEHGGHCFGYRKEEGELRCRQIRYNLGIENTFFQKQIAMQHKILVLDYTMETLRKKQTRKINKQIRRWKLKKDEDRAEYQASVTTKLDEIGLDLDWNKIQEILVSTAK